MKDKMEGKESEDVGEGIGRRRGRDDGREGM